MESIKRNWKREIFLHKQVPWLERGVGWKEKQTNVQFHQQRHTLCKHIMPNIIKHEARDRVVYKVFFLSAQVFAVSATWLDHYCVYVWEWERRRKGMHSETKSFTVWITGYTSPDEPRPILWARSPAEGSGSGAWWAKRLHTAVESGCVGWSRSPLKSSADPTHSVSRALLPLSHA